MKWIFNSIYILENKLLFSIISIITISIILLAILLVIKEIRKNAD